MGCRLRGAGGEWHKRLACVGAGVLKKSDALLDCGARLIHRRDACAPFFFCGAGLDLMEGAIGRGCMAGVPPAGGNSSIAGGTPALHFSRAGRELTSILDALWLRYGNADIEGCSCKIAFGSSEEGRKEPAFLESGSAVLFGADRRLEKDGCG